MTQVINWAVDSGDGVYIGGGDPNDTNHTPLRTMTFSFRAKSFQQQEDSQKELHMMNKVSGPTGTPETVKYITKANIGTINERGADDLTGVSYVSELTGPTVGNAVCLGVVYGGQLALNAAFPGAGT